MYQKYFKNWWLSIVLLVFFYYYLFFKQSIIVRNKIEISYVIEIKTLTRLLKLGRKCDGGFEKKVVTLFA